VNVAAVVLHVFQSAATVVGIMDGVTLGMLGSLSANVLGE